MPKPDKFGFDIKDKDIECVAASSLITDHQILLKFMLVVIIV
jgi:hypothetical protein